MRASGQEGRKEGKETKKGRGGGGGEGGSGRATSDDLGEDGGEKTVRGWRPG